MFSNFTSTSWETEGQFTLGWIQILESQELGYMARLPHLKRDEMLISQASMLLDWDIQTVPDLLSHTRS